MFVVYLGDYTLQIDHVTLEDDADFQCQVSPGNGVPGIRSKIAHISVLIKPEQPQIIQAPRLETRAGDKEVELECVSRNGKPAATVSQRKTPCI